MLDGTLRQWSFDGYGMSVPCAEVEAVELITAPAIVAVLKAGYRVRLHQSASEGSIDGNWLSPQSAVLTAQAEPSSHVRAPADFPGWLPGSAAGRRQRSPGKIHRL